MFNTCSEELSRNLRILQRRGGILSRPYRLFWSSKYFTPFRTVMSTPGSRCKPPANRTRTPDFHNRQNRNSRESSTFPIIFFPAWRRKLWDSHSFSMIKYTTSSLSYFHLSLLFFAPTSMFSIDNYMYVIHQKEKKKKACFSDALVWRMGKRRTLVTLSTTFLLLSEHSQVLTFFSPGFALLYTFFFSITHGVLYSNLTFWKT